MIDVVIVSNSSTASIRTMTRMAIKSARENAGCPIGKIVVVEQCRWVAPYPGTKMLYYGFDFNYNKCLNLGFAVCKSQYVSFCNNDLYFERNWAKNAIASMKEFDYLSVSPTNKHIFKGVREGYTIGKLLLGWCIIVDRRVIDIIEGFDTPVKFWYSDNVYAHQLQRAGIKHALVGSSRVKHFTSFSLRKIIKGKERLEMQKGQEKLFNDYVHTSSKIETKKSKGN